MAHYFDPDYIANGAQDQLPAIASIGAGPRGSGLYVGGVTEDTGFWSFWLKSDLTGEKVMESPNLHAGKLTIDYVKPKYPGHPGTMKITVRRGDESYSYDIPVEAGVAGSRIYLHHTIPYKKNRFYTLKTSDLVWNGDGKITPWDYELPRPGDCVYFFTEELKGTKDYKIRAMMSSVNFATEEACQVTAQSVIDIPVPRINENGNWEVAGVDTGMRAKGDKGTFRAPSAVTLEPGEDAWVKDLSDDPTEAEYQFGIPKGEPGEQGKPGKDGESFHYDGAFNSLEELLAHITDPKDGDAYIIDGTVYIWNEELGEWVTSGVMQGPKGDKGDPGEPGKDGEPGKGLQIDDVYETWEDLLEKLPNPEPGTQVKVGDNIYIWVVGDDGTGEWKLLTPVGAVDGTIHSGELIILDETNTLDAITMSDVDAVQVIDNIVS